MKISRFLSLVLRHKPQAANVRLNNGWCNVETLISNMNKMDYDISIEDIVRIVKEDDKQRYSFSEDNTIIRANQGHSFYVDLGLTPTIPPDILYHGTSESKLYSILLNGISRMKREFVHLSTDLTTASKVGARHGVLELLTVNSKQMYLDGYKFYLSENKVWLTKFVPCKYVEVVSQK